MRMNEFKYNLLIIEEDSGIIKSLFGQFHNKYNVFTATNASDTFYILEKENINVVLLEQRITELYGVNLFTKIKNKYPDSLKLILTGFTDLEAVVGAINDGQIFIYKTKPWNGKELILAIEDPFVKYEVIFKNRRVLKTLEETNSLLEEKIKVQKEKLENANQVLQNLSLEKNKFMGIVAHDLRNSIGAIQSFPVC